MSEFWIFDQDFDKKIFHKKEVIFFKNFDKKHFQNVLYS